MFILTIVEYNDVVFLLKPHKFIMYWLQNNKNNLEPFSIYACHPCAVVRVWWLWKGGGECGLRVWCCIGAIAYLLCIFLGLGGRFVSAWDCMGGIPCMLHDDDEGRVIEPQLQLEHTCIMDHANSLLCIPCQLQRCMHSRSIYPFVSQGSPSCLSPGSSLSPIQWARISQEAAHAVALAVPE